MIFGGKRVTRELPSEPPWLPCLDSSAQDDSDPWHGLFITEPLNPRQGVWDRSGPVRRHEAVLLGRCPTVGSAHPCRPG